MSEEHNLNMPFWYFKVSITLLLSLLTAFLFYSFTFYVHEAGHLVIGSLIQIARLKLPIPIISNWIFLLNIIPLPQQTKVLGLGHNVLFALGGSVFILIAITLITIKLFDRKKKHTWLILALPIVFFMHELTGNFLYGTDNHLGQPILQSSGNQWLQYFVPGTPWAIAIIALPFIWNWKFVIFLSMRLSQNHKTTQKVIYGKDL
ncbi:MAG: hypothetical protein QW165_01245 [Candidatus Woesearchaeota archaeon]